MSNDTNPVKTKRFKVPHTYVIICMIILLAFIGTYIMPAGEYQRVEDPNGRTVVDADSFTSVPQNPVKFFSFTEDHLFSSVHRGMQDASNIIFFILIVGGAFAMIQGTGAINAGIGKLALGLKDKGSMIIPVMLFIFGVGGSTIGMAEETIVFIPIGIALARALGYDAIVGVAMITLGASAGFSGGIANPFTVGVAQGIAELPIYSGAMYRVVIFAVFQIAAFLYVMRYAKKVKADPQISAVRELEIAEKDQIIDLSELPKFTTKHIYVFITVIIGFVAMIYGVMEHDWYIRELSSLFLMMGIFASLIGGSSPSKASSDFVLGAKDLIFGALVVGIARAILMVMSDGQIIDSLVYSMAAGISTFGTTIGALFMYLVQIVLNLFIPSGSGQAATTMPIMVPLSDLIGVSRQTAVLAYQLGDGITNLIIPTSGTIMGVIAISKIPYEKWVKWVAPYVGILLLIGAVFVAMSNIIGLT
ncbi:C4-dicarboxylate anaerobic carrier [Alkaliphilus metalliredigens QYMF]|uniref:C4-dicarboxylate anaerobic carrier n=1 Tax=Alkaliphilus metalliredigens (strain QYMF) TaxID=293826 RepID=A6TJB5_ALKMQ|nr:AbgT family transporter [Alkaliphilus metalliredigens]ABR46283.1 C4-dicarboxylate anaerobic carrier [Alkaliphilus metalliredigens QYMF]